MFDIAFSELIVIGIVALVVIGPERLPKVARTAGLLLGRLQRYVSDVKADISREMQLDDLRKLQSEVQESARSFERSIASGMQSIEQNIGHAAESVKAELPPAVTDNPDASPASGAQQPATRAADAPPPAARE